MKRVKLVVAYDGTNYCGWQLQPNGVTIEEVLNRTLTELLREPIMVIGASRTDSGVHARRYVANFHADCTIPMDRLPYALNSFLPEDIAVSGAVEVPEDFDARFNCTKKEYAYYLFPSTLRDPFHARYAYRYNYPLDITKMQEGAQYFVGKQDFASVRSQGTPVKSTVRTIFWCEVEPVDDLIRIRVCGDGFLYNMVRAIAGTLTYVGGGKLAPEQVRVIPIAEAHQAYARQVAQRLEAAGVRASADCRNEKMGYKIREGQLQKVPYMLVVGAKEMEDGTVSVRARKEENGGVKRLEEFEAQILEEIRTKAR